MFLLKWSLTLAGPLYFGYQASRQDYVTDPLLLPIGWAIFCALWFMSSNRAALRQARANADAAGERPMPALWAGFGTLLLFIVIVSVFAVVHLVVYFSAKSLAG